MKKILARLRMFKPNGRLALGILLFSSLVMVEPAFAETGQANGALLGLASILAIVIHILTFLVLLIMSWGGDLIGTTFITGPDAMEAIRPMWVFIRNLVNISFVLVLLFLAFANLFSSLSGGQGNWTIKDKLPRVIIALIAVNFSLLIFRVAIDAVHVGTITILSITDTVMEEKQAKNPAAILQTGINNLTYEKCGENIDGNPLNRTANPNAEEGGAGEKGICIPFYRYVEYALCPKGDTDDSDCLVKFHDEVTEKNAIIKASSSTEQNIFWAFGTYFQKLELLPILAGKLNSLTGVISSTLFSAIMAIMYSVAWVAIFIALAVRIVVLWFLMIMSPALIAAQVMGFGGSMGDVQKRLTTNLIMPIKIAAAFALSFVMIATMIEVSPDNFTTILEPGKALKPFWGVSSSPFGIMWQIMTVVVFWMAVWWALSGSEAEFINNGIKGATEQVGKYTGNWALDRVRIPSFEKGKEGVSIRALKDIGPVLQSEEAARTRKNRDDLAGFIGFGGGDAQQIRAFDSAISKFGTAVDRQMTMSQFRLNFPPEMIKALGPAQLKQLYDSSDIHVRNELKEQGITSKETFVTQIDNASIEQIKERLGSSLVSGAPSDAAETSNNFTVKVGDTSVSFEPGATPAATSATNAVALERRIRSSLSVLELEQIKSTEIDSWVTELKNNPLFANANETELKKALSVIAPESATRSSNP